MQLRHLLQRQYNLLAIVALGVAVTFLPGCDLVDLQIATCDVSGDPHCFQEAAVQSENADNCDTVAQKEEFKKVGSNPPRDKCVVMVAANNEDPTTCKKAQGGLLSYSEQDCLKGIADTASRPDTCKTLGQQYIEVCVNSVTKNTIADIDEFSKKPKKTDEDVQILQQKMKDLEKMNEMMTDVIKAEFEMKKAIVANLRG